MTFRLAGASLLAITLVLAGCNVAAGGGNADEPGSRAAATAAAAERAPDTPIDVDTSYLSDEDRKVVNLLLEAAALMTPVYQHQMISNYDEMRRQVEARNDPALLARFDRNMGPWDAFDDDKPFFGGPRPAGAGYYPADLTKDQFDTYLKAHPDEAKALTSPYTVVKRQGDKLIAVPYSVEYKQWLEPAAKTMEEAAAITSNPSLKKFLTLRAKSFRTDDYFESEMAWMDLKDTPIEFVIGPYESYSDGLYGQKTAFEAYVTLRNPEESKALDIYKSHLRDMEAHLPVDEKYKNFRRGFESPISVVDQVNGGGEAVHGIPSIAFNLPNDEKVREAKGAKKVILKNLVEAKFDKIAGPMANLVLIPDQARMANARYMMFNTLFHELSHSLGPGTIMVGGKQTTVSQALKEEASGLEESKADMLGLWNVLYMQEQGVLPASEGNHAMASYVVDLFRHLRMGMTDAHAVGAAFQYRYLSARGAIVWDEAAKRFRFDPAKFKPALAAMIADTIRLQGDGDYAGTKAFIARWAVEDDHAKAVTATMTHLPIDIHPVYKAKV